MPVNNPDQRRILVIIADGFEEIETITMLSLLRQAGFCVTSVGQTSGLISGAHGIWVMPDQTLVDLDCSSNPSITNAVVLPEGKQSLIRLETDPRVHRLLRQAVAQGGQIATSREGLRVPRAAAVWDNGPGEIEGDQEIPVLVREPGQSPAVFVQNLVRRLEQPPRT